MSYHSDLKYLHGGVKKRLEQFGSDQLELHGRYSSEFRQKLSEHIERLNASYSRARQARNMAIMRSKKNNEFDLQKEIEIKDKFNKRYINEVVNENKSFSDWLFMHQNDNLIKSRDSINSLISEMRMAQPVQLPAPEPFSLQAGILENVEMGNFADVEMPPSPQQRRDSFDELIEEFVGNMDDDMYDPNLYVVPPI